MAELMQLFFMKKHTTIGNYDCVAKYIYIKKCAFRINNNEDKT